MPRPHSVPTLRPQSAATRPLSRSAVGPRVQSGLPVICCRSTGAASGCQRIASSGAVLTPGTPLSVCTCNVAPRGRRKHQQLQGACLARLDGSRAAAWRGSALAQGQLCEVPGFVVIPASA
eukprot:362441-Chlamydomonas_euryale.AAC.1